MEGALLFWSGSSKGVLHAESLGEPSNFLVVANGSQHKSVFSLSAQRILLAHIVWVTNGLLEPLLAVHSNTRSCKWFWITEVKVTLRHISGTWVNPIQIKLHYLCPWFILLSVRHPVFLKWTIEKRENTGIYKIHLKSFKWMKFNHYLFP